MNTVTAIAYDVALAGQTCSGATLLLVDDESAVTQSLRRNLRQALARSTSIEASDSGDEALERIHARSFDINFSDLYMPGMVGLRPLQRAAGVQPLCTRPILSAKADFESAQTAANSFGVNRDLTKPWHLAA